MRYDNREDSEYYSRGSEYRILSDEMKIIDNEFQAGRGAKTGNTAEERQPLQKRMRRFRVLMSTLFLAASTAVISGGAPKKEALPQETAVEAVVNSETAVNEETVEETQGAAQEEGVVLSESEKAYLDSLAKALADKDYERAKELIVDPLLETIWVDRYGGESYIYADGKCYPSNEFTGTGLWIAWMDEAGHGNWPASGWAQFENGMAHGEGAALDCADFKEDYYASHAFTWYVGQFGDGLANGQGEYLDEYFSEGRLESMTKSKGEFRDGQIYSGTVGFFFDNSDTPETSYVVQDGETVKKVENMDGETITYTGEDVKGDYGFSANDIFIN